MALQVIEAKSSHDQTQKFYVYDVVNGERRGAVKAVFSDRDAAERYVRQMKDRKKVRFV